MATIIAPVPPRPPPAASSPDPDEHLFRELSQTEGKAEIINGKVVPLDMSGPLLATAGFKIVLSLHLKFGQRKGLIVGPDSLDYKVNLPHRRTFRPDASYYVGPDTGMDFLEGPPRFAAEVRSKNDYGLKAEREMLDKRRDYFGAGTLVVWDVDLLGQDVIRVYRNGNADTPASIFRRGDLADAEPPVPGWTMPVDDLFPPTSA